MIMGYYSDCWTYPKEKIDAIISGLESRITSTKAEVQADYEAKIAANNHFAIETIPDEADLDEYLTPGFYGVGSSSSAGTIVHAPDSAAFTLIVMKKGAAAYEVQLLTTGLAIYTRNRTSGGWSAWKTYTNSNVSK